MIKQQLMWKILLFGMFIAGIRAYNKLSEQDTYLSPYGLVFLKEDEIIISQDNWNIVLVINATQHLKNIEHLTKNLKILETNMKETKINNAMFDEQLRNINSILDNLLVISEMLAINQTEQYGSTIFDAANNKDIHKLTEIVYNFQNTETIEETFPNYQLSITKSLNRKVEDNIEKLTQITNIINEEITKIDGVNDLINDKIRRLETLDNYYLNLTKFFCLFESISLQSLILANKLEVSLEVAAEGKLSVSLLSAKELQSELLKIKTKSPFGLTLMSGLTTNNMYKYRETAEVTALGQGDLLLFSIKIPLLSKDSRFNLYKVHSIPVIDKNSDKIIRILPENENFIVSNNKQFYGTMTNEDLRKCKGHSPKICPALMTLTTRTVPSCISSVYYRNKGVIDLICKYNLILNHHRPLWILDRKNMGWIYSVSKRTKVTLYCQENSSVDVELIGTNILSNVSHCLIVGQDFRLFRTSESVTDSNRNFSIVYKQSVGPILNTSIADQLLNAEVVKNAIDKMRRDGYVKDGPGNSEEIKLEILLARIEDSSHHFANWKIVILPFFVSMIISIACCYLILYFDKNHLPITAISRNHRKKIMEEESASVPLKD